MPVYEYAAYHGQNLKLEYRMKKTETFDINAPIEHQFTRGGRKVLKIVDMGVEICPLRVVIGNQVFTHHIAGNYYRQGISDFDLVTRVPPKPDTVYYRCLKRTSTDGYNTRTEAEALGHIAVYKKSGYFAIIRITINGETDKITTKTVWKCPKE